MMMKKGNSITLRQIAEKAEVAPATVSRALNHHPAISPPTVERVLRAARELGYDLAPKRRVVAVLLPRSDRPLGLYFLGLINAIREEAAAREWILEAFGLNDIDFLHERLVTGILTLDYIPGSVRELCAKYNLPLVSINNIPNYLDQANEVFSNDRKAIANAVSYLCGYGHRRIGFLSPSLANRRRDEAFQEACREFGVTTGDAILFVPNRPIDRKHRFLFQEAIEEVIAQKLTAIILPVEYGGGANLLAAFREFRLRVPEDISVIAWETPQVSEYLDPPLTTFEQNFRGMAAAAFGILEELMNRRPAAADVAIDYLFHERRSVAPPANLKPE